MAVKVKISNLKSIKTLEFDVPLTGAYIITGANGCGKTSLLTVLHRMGAKSAFQTGLPGGQTTSDVDAINNTVVEYDVNGKTVSYRYNNTRWSATPRSQSTLIGKAFAEVLFLKADASRVEPTANELKGAKKLAADAELREFMNSVFDTNKFDRMYHIKLQGRNTIAHMIDTSATGARKKSYYSEKAFSLGELCVMRLGQKMLSMKNGGLYIIDEFEMALHPAAQIRLFSEIERIANKANCVALVSTHSSSLIKTVKRGQIIYLENNNGHVSIHRNVYPTYALQHLTLEEESAPDKLIFVEDVSAKHCVDEMWKQYIARRGPVDKSLPSIHTAVIGGYKEVMRFLERSSAFVPAVTKRMAALDLDAEPICMPPVVSAGNSTASLTVPQQLYQSLKNNIVFLPWTPEVGFCELLRADLSNHTTGLKNYTGVTNLRISHAAVNAHVGKTGRAERDTCKTTFDTIAESIASKKSCSSERAREDLFGYLVKCTHASDPNTINMLCGKLFS